MPVTQVDSRVSVRKLSPSSVARVLLADDDLASRLTLKTILSTAGYEVDCVATSSEAIGRLETGEYQLVLADLQASPGEAAGQLLSYARQKDYRPATARIVSQMSEITPGLEGEDESVVSIADDNISDLLELVADLISHRADRRMLRAMRQVS
ncbi:MAG: response regulator [Bryobacterales bacterium]|nr:response regulator [Bryobacterales bacterium]